MKQKFIDPKYVPEHIACSLQKSKKGSTEIKNANFHHNSSYRTAPNILSHGILSMRKLNSLGVLKLTSKQLQMFDDNSSHINGVDGISLSVVGLKDLYRGEEEYNPYRPSSIDYVISDEINARRKSTHYGNEFITYNDISLSKIKSLDVRLLKLIEQKRKNGTLNDEKVIKDLIYKYNMLITIAKDIRKKELDIKMREMSDKEINLDIKKISGYPILVPKL